MAQAVLPCTEFRTTVVHTDRYYDTSSLPMQVQAAPGEEVIYA